MAGQTTGRIESLAMLADPVRRRLYDAVVDSAEGLSREQAAEAAVVPAHSARFHLDRLVEAGLLDVAERRLSGRTGPGAGRPAKVYRRAPGTVEVSLPPRRYDLVASVFAAAVERSLRGEELTAALAREARAAGEDDARSTAAEGGDEERTTTVLASRGFAPYLSDEGIRLRNCPFDALAKDHTELVCGVNRDYVAGVVDGLGCRGLAAVLDPGEDRCCVRITRA